jgi:hypothetical protein
MKRTTSHKSFYNIADLATLIFYCIRFEVWPKQKPELLKALLKKRIKLNIFSIAGYTQWQKVQLSCMSWSTFTSQK